MSQQVTKNGRTYTVYTNRELDTVKGHKRTIEKTGTNGFYEVRCECGWHKGGFNKRRAEVVASHRSHCEMVLDGEA